MTTPDGPPGRRPGPACASASTWAAPASASPRPTSRAPSRTRCARSPATSSTARTSPTLAALVEELGAVEVVVGLPLLLSGQEGEAARLARAYAVALAARVGTVTVRLVDERLTTVDAHRRLRDSGVPGRGQRKVVDQAAAVLILQTALDTEASSGRPPGEPVSTGGRRKKERRR